MFRQFRKNIAYCKSDSMPWIMPQLPPSLNVLISSDTEYKNYRKNEIIISEENYPDSLVYVKSGMIYCTIINSYTDKEQITCALAVNNTLTASAMQLVDYPQHIRIQAAVPSKIAIIPLRNIEKVVRQDSALYKTYLKLAVLCDKTRLETLKICISHSISLRYKFYILAKLITANMQIPNPDADEWIAPPYSSGRPLHHILMNVSKATVDRMMAEWKELGLYKFENYKFYIHSSIFSEFNEFPFYNS